MNSTYVSKFAEFKFILTGVWITDLANATSFIFHEVRDLNWVGFYLWSGQKLILGPFQGKVACTEIEIGSGVCGQAALKREIIIVPDVHQFSGHITCDEASASEIVLPIIKDDLLLGVLDVDSPIKDRFQDRERELFSSMVELLKTGMEKKMFFNLAPSNRNDQSNI